MASRAELVERYAAYLAVCNAHAWPDLEPFLADPVVVNGVTTSRRDYIANLAALDAVFPDYHWELRRVVHEDDRLAVHLTDRGTRRGAFLGAPGDGSPVQTEEFAIYRFSDGRIVEVDVTADNERLTRTVSSTA